MTTFPNWISNAPRRKSWAHLAWPDFSNWTKRGDVMVILPLCPLVKAGGQLLGHAEHAGGDFLAKALAILGDEAPVLVLPPLRHLPSLGGKSVLPVPYSLAHAMVLSIAGQLREQGFGKLVLWSPLHACKPFAAAVAIDARERHGLSTYILSPVRDLGEHTSQGAAAHAETASHLREISAHRPGASTVSAPTRFPSPVGAGSLQPGTLLARRLDTLDESGIEGVKGSLVLVPFGAIEQHGRHLPVGVDSILGQAFLAQLCPHIPPRENVLVAPAVTIGKSNEHAGWPGTLSIDAPMLLELAVCTARGLSALGARRIRFFNTHGGNTAVLASAVHELESAGIDVGMLVAPFRPTLSPQENAWGMHADEWETSLMLACAGDLVDMGRAVAEYPHTLEATGALAPERSAATFAWLTSDLSRSGVMGDPLPSTAAKGAAWLLEEGRSLASVVLPLCTSETT